MNQHIRDAQDHLDRAERALVKAAHTEGVPQIEALDRLVTACRLAAVEGLRAMADLAEAIDPEFAKLCRANPCLGMELSPLTVKAREGLAVREEATV